MTVTIRYGSSNELTRNLDRGATVGSVLADRGIASALGFGSNVQGVIQGVIQNDRSILSEGDVLTVETKANSKA